MDQGQPDAGQGPAGGSRDSLSSQVRASHHPRYQGKGFPPLTPPLGHQPSTCLPFSPAVLFFLLFPLVHGGSQTSQGEHGVGPLPVPCVLLSGNASLSEELRPTSHRGPGGPAPVSTPPSPCPLLVLNVGAGQGGGSASGEGAEMGTREKGSDLLSQEPKSRASFHHRPSGELFY